MIAYKTYKKTNVNFKTKISLPNSNPFSWGAKYMRVGKFAIFD